MDDVGVLCPWNVTRPDHEYLRISRNIQEYRISKKIDVDDIVCVKGCVLGMSPGRINFPAFDISQWEDHWPWQPLWLGLGFNTRMEIFHFKTGIWYKSMFLLWHWPWHLLRLGAVHILRNTGWGGGSSICFDIDYGTCCDYVPRLCKYCANIVQRLCLDFAKILRRL